MWAWRLHSKSLHRIEPASIRDEVEATGFVLDAESTMLANDNDPHSAMVFDRSIKGNTDRFVSRFVSPDRFQGRRPLGNRMTSAFSFR